MNAKTHALISTPTQPANTSDMTSRATNHFLFLIILLVIGIFGWVKYQSLPAEIEELSKEVLQLLPYILGGAVVLAIYIASMFIPFIGEKIGEFFFSSPEQIEDDPAREARALVSQGEYEAAIEAFQEIAEETDNDRMPVVEIVRIYRDRLKDPASAIQYLYQILEAKSWGPDNAAYLLFRLSELHNEDMGDIETAKTILEQVVSQFEGTRHAANASHKLRHWGEEGKVATTSPFGMDAYASSESQDPSQAGETADLPPAEDDSDEPDDSEDPHPERPA